MVTRKGGERNDECVEKATAVSAAPFQPEVGPIEAAVRKLGKEAWLDKSHVTPACGLTVPPGANMPQPRSPDASTV